MSQAIMHIADAGIDEGCAVSNCHPGTIVDMTKDVVTRPHLEHCIQQILAPDPFMGFTDVIPNAVGWPMRDQYIGIHRDQAPFGLDFCSPVKVKGQIIIPGLPGGAVKLQPFQDDGLVFQINGVGEQGACGRGRVCKRQIMIPRYQNLVAVGQCAEVGIEISDFVQCAVPALVTRMNQHITGRNFHLPVHSMGITNGDNR